MNGHHDSGDLDNSLPGEAAVPLLHGPMTVAERIALDETRERAREKEADAAYKQRQISISESANRATWANITLTLILAIFTAIAAGAAWYQGHIAKLSAKASQDAVTVARDTLTETQNSNNRQAALADAARKSSETAAINLLRLQ